MSYSKSLAALTAGLSLFALSSAAFAQTAPRSLTIGQTIRGELTTRDLKAEDDSFYDEFTLRLTAGQGVIISMDAPGFDAITVIGKGNGGSFEPLAADDDSGAGENGTNARLRFRAPEDGLYVVRANSVNGGEVGPYTLTVAARPPAATPKTAALAVTTTERTLTGALAEGGARMEEEGDQLYDLYTLSLRKGDVLRVRMSAGFDSRLVLVPDSGGDPVAMDDDSGGGNGDALLIYRAENAGAFRLRAEAFAGDSTGDYTLTASLLPPPPARAPRPTGIRKGQTINAALAGGDPVMNNYTMYDDYTLNGRKGETVTIKVASPTGGFDPVLAVGGLVAGRFAIIEENDDNPEGGENQFDSKLTFTFEESGPVILRVRSINDGATGPYRISVE
jgi:hypothetical protein